MKVMHCRVFTPFEPLNNKYYLICDLTLFSFVPLCLSFCLRWIYVIKVGVHLLFWSALFVFVICLLYNIMPIYQPLLLYYDTTSVQAMMHSHGFIPPSLQYSKELRTSFFFFSTGSNVHHFIVTG